MRPLNKARPQHKNFCNRLLPLPLLILVFASVILSACSSHYSHESLERELLKRSSQQLPKWISQLPSSEQYFYALGVSTNANSIREGRQFAAKSAIVEVSNYLGLKASGRFEVKRTEFTTRILEDISTTTSANLKRSRLTQMYYEQFRYQANDESAQVFDVYVLLRIPLAYLQQEQVKKIQLENKILLEAQVINQEAQSHLNNGNFPLAWHKWMLALRLIDEETTDRMATLKIYKSLLTAVEGVKLSINELPNSASSALIIRAVYSSHDGEIPLKDLSLHLRLSNTGLAGQIKKTNQSGKIKQALTSANAKGLQIRLMMSSYSVDIKNLSTETTQKITFLISMLENKLAQYGDVSPAGRFTKNAEHQSTVITSRNIANTGIKATSIINIDVATDNPYVLLNNQQRYPVTLKIDISATQSASIKRPPLNLAVVLDKSGSMHSDNKIDFTKKATQFLIDHLSMQDYLAIVAYSSDVDVIIPSELVTSKTVIKHHLSEIEVGGMTNLSGGLFEGYSQVKTHFNSKGINRILLLSDGVANRGITQTDALLPYITQYNTEGIGVSALGVGEDYNAELMIMLAENSQGNYYYIKNPEDIPGIFSQELTRLINLAIQNIRVIVHLTEGVKLVNSFGYTYTIPSKNKYEFRLGDLNFDGRGMLLLELSVPPDTEKNRKIAEIEISYNNISTQKNVNYKKSLSISYTQDVSLHKQSVNLDVEKYAILIHSIEELESVLESLDNGLFEQAIKNIRKTYASIEDYSRGSEDAEFLQRLKLLKHFEEEVIELKESGELHLHDKDRYKSLGYQLYLEKHSHQTVDHPLHSNSE